MATFKKALHFYILITSHKRIRVDTLADKMECSRQTIYRLISEASSFFPIQLEQGVVIYRGEYSLVPNEKK